MSNQVNKPATPNGLTNEQIIMVEQSWHNRVKFYSLRGNSRKPSKAYLNGQASFFAGAMSALQASTPLWVFSIMRGDDILEERKEFPLSCPDEAASMVNS